MSPLKNPPFGNAVPEFLYKTCNVMHVGQVVDGDWATFILWARDFGPISSIRGDTWTSEIQGISDNLEI